MKKFILLITLISNFSFSQTYITNAQVYDFAVGDIIQSGESYSIMTSYITREYLEKSYSTDSNTVYYTIRKSTYTPQFDQQGSTTFTVDTLVESHTDLSDTVNLPLQEPLTYEDSLNHSSDSLYIRNFDLNCDITVYHSYYDPLVDCFECGSSSSTYIPGLGSYYSQYGDFGGVSPFSIGTWLIYYKKGSQECGTFKSSVKETEALKELNIYPNPAQSELHIEADFHFDSYSIYGIEGSKLSSKNSSEKQIDLTNLKKGIYFLELKEGSELLARKKFIKN